MSVSIKKAASPSNRIEESSESQELSGWFESNFLSKRIKFDSVYDLWEKDRKQLLSGTNTPIFPEDHRCEASIRLGDNVGSSKRRCIGCHVVATLSERGKIGSNKEIKIATGFHEGMRLHIKSIPLVHNRLSPYLVEGNKRIATSREYHIGMISSLMENLLRKANEKEINSGNYEQYSISGLPTFRWMYSCKDDAYMVYESTDLGEGTLEKVAYSCDSTETDLASNYIRYLIRCLITQLTILSKNSFSHGSPCLSYMAFSSVDSSLYLHILPSSKSKIVIDNVYYEHGIGSWDEPAVRPVLGFPSSTRQEAGLPLLPEYVKSSTLAYKLGNKHSTRTYSSSYDIYFFLISMIRSPQMWKNVFSDERTLESWKGLWLPKEYSSLMEDINALPDNSHASIRSVLGKYHLRTDALPYLYSEFL